MREKCIIKLEAVSFTYKETGRESEVLSGVNLEINRSDFVVILGPSGSGKTTLLNLIAGFIKPSTGKIIKDGRIIKSAGKDRGVVFQSANLYPWLNVEQNIRFGLKIQGFSKREMKRLTDEYLQKTALSAYAKYYPFELSGGMKQRLSLARTLITKPDIVLMDEPFGALDAITRADMQRFVRLMWAKEAKTFLLITHDIDEALTLANRVVVMSANEGRIVKEFRVEYYKKLLAQDDAEVEEEESYRRIKREILHIITQS